MALGACGKLSKGILLILNTALLLVAIITLSLGLLLRFSDDNKDLFEVATNDTVIGEFLSGFVIGVTALIALGSVLLVVVAFGGFSAYKENRRGLGLFAVLLALLVALLVAALGVLAYFDGDFDGDFNGDLVVQSEFYGAAYGLYVAEKDPAAALTLKYFHVAFHCCGNLGGLWESKEVRETCPKPWGGFWDTLPACPAVIARAFESGVPVVDGIFLGTGAVLLAALACTIVLIGHIKKGPRALPAPDRRVLLALDRSGLCRV